MSLLWQKRPLRELLRLSIPAGISMLSYSVMSLIDVLLAKQQGTAALAGVGAGGMAAFAFLCFQMGVLRGAKTLISQAVGADHKEEVGPYTSVSLWFALGVGILSAALGPFLARIFQWTAPEKEMASFAALYIRIRLLGAPMVLLYCALREVRYAQGDSRSPMVATLLANVVNLVLALWFQRVLHWGVAGLAWATVCAHTIEAGCLLLVHWVRKEPWRGGTWWHVRRLLSVGLPVGLQSMLEVGAFYVVTMMLFAWGKVYSAAHHIAAQILHLSFLPSFAVAESAAVLAGQAVGAQREDLVIPVAVRACILTSLYAALCTLVLVGWAPALICLFVPPDIKDPKELALLIPMAIRLLHIAAVFQILDGANMVARSTLRGCGDVRFAAWVGVITSWVCTPPLAWLFGRIMYEKSVAAWLGLCCEIVLGATLFWWRLWKQKWRPAARALRERGAVHE